MPPPAPIRVVSARVAAAAAAHAAHAAAAAPPPRVELSFSNGAGLEVRDNGEVSATGKGAEAVASLLGLPAKSAGS